MIDNMALFLLISSTVVTLGTDETTSTECVPQKAITACNCWLVISQQGTPWMVDQCAMKFGTAITMHVDTQRIYKRSFGFGDFKNKFNIAPETDQDETLFKREMKLIELSTRDFERVLQKDDTYFERSACFMTKTDATMVIYKLSYDSESKKWMLCYQRGYWSKSLVWNGRSWMSVFTSKSVNQGWEQYIVGKTRQVYNTDKFSFSTAKFNISKYRTGITRFEKEWKNLQQGALDNFEKVDNDKRCEVMYDLYKNNAAMIYRYCVTERGGSYTVEYELRMVQPKTPKSSMIRNALSIAINNIPISDQESLMSLETYISSQGLYTKQNKTRLCMGTLLARHTPATFKETFSPCIETNIDKFELLAVKFSNCLDKVMKWQLRSCVDYGYTLAGKPVQVYGFRLQRIRNDFEVTFELFDVSIPKLGSHTSYLPHLSCSDVNNTAVKVVCDKAVLLIRQNMATSLVGIKDAVDQAIQYTDNNIVITSTSEQAIIETDTIENILTKSFKLQSKIRQNIMENAKISAVMQSQTEGLVFINILTLNDETHLFKYTLFYNGMSGGSRNYVMNYDAIAIKDCSIHISSQIQKKFVDLDNIVAERMTKLYAENQREFIKRTVVATMCNRKLGWSAILNLIHQQTVLKDYVKTTNILEYQNKVGSKIIGKLQKLITTNNEFGVIVIQHSKFHVGFYGYEKKCSEGSCETSYIRMIGYHFAVMCDVPLSVVQNKKTPSFEIKIKGATYCACNANPNRKCGVVFDTYVEFIRSKCNQDFEVEMKPNMTTTFKYSMGRDDFVKSVYAETINTKLTTANNNNNNNLMGIIKSLMNAKIGHFAYSTAQSDITNHLDVMYSAMNPEGVKHRISFMGVVAGNDGIFIYGIYIQRKAYPTFSITLSTAKLTPKTSA